MSFDAWTRIASGVMRLVRFRFDPLLRVTVWCRYDVEDVVWAARGVDIGVAVG